MLNGSANLRGRALCGPLALAVLLLGCGNVGRSSFPTGNISSLAPEQVCVERGASGPAACVDRSSMHVPAGVTPEVGDCVQLEVSENTPAEIRAVSWTGHCTEAEVALGATRRNEAIAVLIPECLSSFRFLTVEDEQRQEIWKIERQDPDGAVREVVLGETPSGFRVLIPRAPGEFRSPVTVYVEQQRVSAPPGTVRFEPGELGAEVLSGEQHFPSPESYYAADPCSG